MPRSLRIEFEGAFYHIYSRGNNRQPIFRDDNDFLYFLKNLEKQREKFRVRLYAFSLLNTHFHFLLETEKANLSRMMHDFLTKYAVYFKKKYAAEGHIFQGRYQAILCDRDSYLLALSRYIHLNPYHAGLCDDPLQYPWSSLPVYLGMPCKYSLKVETALILQLMGGEAHYLKYIRDEIQGASKPWCPAPRYSFLGSGEFVKGVLEKLKERRWEARHLDSLQKKFVLETGETPFRNLARQVCEFYHIPEESLFSKSRKRKVVKARGVLALLSKERLGLKLSGLSEKLGMGKRTLLRCMERISKDERIKKDMEVI